MKGASALLALFLATFASAATSTKPVITDNAASCDIGTYAAATLLLPYFEVDFRSPATKAIDTVFTVVNTSRNPQIARVTIWTDLGFPAAWFPIFLTGYGTRSVSMYGILAMGNFPSTSSRVTPGSMSAANDANPNFSEDMWCWLAGGTVPQSSRERLQRMLTTGERDNGCLVSTPHTLATGYATIDVVNDCAYDSPMSENYWRNVILFDNVLTGDYQRINPDVVTGNYAGGNPLVHIRAVPEGGVAGSATSQVLPYTFYDRYTPAGARHIDRRQPLPSVFAARWINGGPTGFLTRYVLWREGVVGVTADQCDYTRNAKLPVQRAGIVRFDEHENAAVMQACDNCPGAASPVASVVTNESDLFPPMGGSDVGGWMWINLDNRAGLGAGSPYSTMRFSQNWVVIQMYAEGRYGVDYDATSMANGCTTGNPQQP